MFVGHLVYLVLRSFSGLQFKGEKKKRWEEQLQERERQDHRQRQDELFFFMSWQHPQRYVRELVFPPLKPHPAASILTLETYVVEDTACTNDAGYKTLVMHSDTVQQQPPSRFQYSKGLLNCQQEDSNGVTRCHTYMCTTTY